MDGKRAQIYPMSLWEEKEKAIEELASTDLAREKFEEWTSFFGQVVEVDQQGRLLLPQELREQAKLTGEVLVLGRGKMLDVVNREEFEKRMRENPLTPEERSRLNAAGV